MNIIRILGGEINKSGELTLLTIFKLRMALALAQLLKEKKLPYVYVFTQGRKEGETGQRPCDLMSMWMLTHNAYCWNVIIPDSGFDLVEESEQVKFVQAVADRRHAKVLHKRHFRGIQRLAAVELESFDSDDIHPSNVVRLHTGI